jgi:hypothetical protein
VGEKVTDRQTLLTAVLQGAYWDFIQAPTVETLKALERAAGDLLAFTSAVNALLGSQ